MGILEITIQRKTSEVWPVVVEHSRPDAISPIRTESEMRLSEEDFAQLTLYSVINPRGYGEVLGSALFTGKTREAFLEARAREPAGLSVLLFVEDKPLQRLYWGRLCAPVEKEWWDFLLLNQRAVFSLYLPSSTDRAYRPIGQRDLRALVVVAQPTNLAAYDLDAFDDAATVQSLRTALGAIPCDVLAATPDADGPPTLEELCRRLSTGQYTLLHLVAHGQVKGGETSLFLTNEQNLVKRVVGESLIRELRRQAQLPHFIFLATCHSAQPNAGLEGLAQRLVTQLGVPTVVAMTEAVQIDTAAALAAAFYQYLHKSGAPDQALAQACAGLTNQSDITVPALYSRLGGRPLFSDTQDRELTPAEVCDGLDHLAALLPARAPVLLPTFQQSAGWLRPVISTGRNNLTAPAQTEWDSAWAVVNKSCDEALDLNFRALALGHEPPPYDARCPFRGLLAFGYDDREFFFGREALVEKLQDKLATHNFLPVLGPSGSGKSSVVLAGLIPALLKTEPDLIWASFTPGSEPLAQLAAALNKLGVGIDETSATKGGSRLLLVVDQFEELFTLCKDEQIRRTFLTRLFDVVQMQRVIITMRADFWGDCAPYTALKEAMQAQQELIAPLTMVELRSVMEQQASAVGLRFEADLANTILDAVANEPGAMPLLQHLLLEMWKRRHGRWLRAKDYSDLGGIREAISRTADEIYTRLSPEDQEWMQTIFVRLTRLSDEVGSEGGRRDTRQRVPISNLIPTGENPDPISKLVQQLASERLVVTHGLEEGDEGAVEVAHEALIRYWPRLRAWLDQDRADLLLREQLRQAAVDWERGAKDSSLLVYRGQRLKDMIDQLDHPHLRLNDQEASYLEACLSYEAPKRLVDLEICILKRQDAGYPVQITLDFDEELPQTFLDPTKLPALFDIPIQQGGKKLFHWLVADERLRRAWTTARLRYPQRRIRLSIASEAAELRSLPWELLRDPGGIVPSQGLATNPSTPFMRYLVGQRYRSNPTFQRPIKVLVVIINPSNLTDYGLAPVNADIHWAALQQATSSLDITLTRLPFTENTRGKRSTSVAKTKRLAVMPLPSTLENITQELRKGYHVLHIICHTTLDNQTGEEMLCLAAEDNRVKFISGQVFANALCRQYTETEISPDEQLRLVIFSNVQPVTHNTLNPFCNPAYELVAKGVPAVLAAGTRMSLDGEQQFIARFYQRLLDHGQIDLAINEARTILLSGQQQDDLVPMLVTRLRDGLLLGRPGYIEERNKASFWPFLLSNIEDRSCVAILGPRVNAGLLPPAERIAEELAKKYSYPLADRQNLARVAQYIAVHDPNLLKREYLRRLQRSQFNYLGIQSSKEQKRLFDRPSLSQTIEALHWSDTVQSLWEAEIHHLLADLPLSLYLTTNVDNFMIQALKARGRNPRQIGPRWNYSWDSPDYVLKPSPSTEHPVVFHLNGFDGDPGQAEHLVLTNDEHIAHMVRLSSARDLLLPRDVIGNLANATLFFLGFAIDDWEFRTMLQLIATLGSGAIRRKFSFVQLDIEATVSSESTRKYFIDQLESFGISEIYFGTPKQFVTELSLHCQRYRKGDEDW